MPIINQVVKGGGGSGPAYYIEKTLDANGVLQNGSTVIDLTGVKSIGSSALAYAYYNNSRMPSVVQIDVENITGSDAFSYAFAGASCSVTSLYVNKLVYVSGNAITNIARTNHGLLSIYLDSLKIMDGVYCISNFIRGTGVTTVRFPALKTVSSIYAFTTALSSMTGVTFHFPSNIQSTIEALDTYPNFGGTNTVVLFDLPATVILTGANSQAYERSPKDDTGTALAWRKQDTGTAPNLVIDWTPYYTSGTADPTVGNTIYSDAACTTAVTTIDSIA